MATSIVCCPRGFWRRGNVEIVCQRYGLFFTETFDEMAKLLRQHLVKDGLRPRSQGSDDG